MQKIFIAVFAFLIAWLSMTNAYVFDVTNWNPFWVLNLSKLIMRDLSHTGIILDADTYTIKIDPEHEDGWEIRVDAICDESWVNCKKVSELWLWGWSSISIKGDPNNFCYKQDDTTLVCDNKILQILLEERWLGWSIKIDWEDWAYCYRKKEDNVLYCDNNSLPSWGGNTIINNTYGVFVKTWWQSTLWYICARDGGSWLICNLTWFITTWQLAELSGRIPTVTWSNWFLCTKSWNNLVCNSTWLDLSDFLSWEDWRLCRRSGNKLICNGRFWNGKLQIVEGDTNTGIYIVGTSWGVIPLDGTWNYQIYIPHIPVVSGTPNYICVKSGNDLDCNNAMLWNMENDKICYYKNNQIICDYTDQVGNQWSGSTWVYVYWSNTWYICTRNGQNTINCFSDPTGFVYTTSNQTINWTKTFQVSPVVPDKTTVAKASWNVIATEYQIRSGDQLLSWRIATLSGRIPTVTWSNWFLCTKSWNNLVCNSTWLDLSDFLSWEDWHLCRRSGNKLICNGRFWNGKLSINNSGNQITIVRTDGLSWSNIPLDGTWLYNVYLPHIPVVSWTNDSICLKSWDDTKCYGTTWATAL